VHWHGLRLENRYDGVPHETQAPIPVGGEFTYRIQFPTRGCTGTTPTSRVSARCRNVWFMGW
jgi:FtsP/CotA-like multicopper oxidase with cupredoxin domain